MEQYQGQTVLHKIAIGKVFLYRKKETRAERKHIEDPEAEIARFDAAKKTALAQLDGIYEKALEEVGADDAAVFEVHKMMMEDEEYLDSVYNRIRGEHINAESAVAATGDLFAGMFAQMDDIYMRSRAADVRDISDRLIAVLSGMGTEMQNLSEPVILMVDDLSPSETVQMDRSKILSFVIRRGSSNSHSAILTRTMNIPAVIGIDIREEWAGKTAIVDGYTGTVIIDPDAATLEQMSAKMCEDERNLE